MSKLKKWIIGITVLGLVSLGVFYIAYRIPWEFHREFDGIYYKLGDDSISEEVHIVFYGQFRNGVWQRDEFKGSIHIGDRTFSRVELRLSKDTVDVLSYYDEMTGDYSSYGSVYSDDLTKGLTICIFDKDKKAGGGGGWNSRDGYMISAPAHDRSEALELANWYMREFYDSNLN